MLSSAPAPKQEEAPQFSKKEKRLSDAYSFFLEQKTGPHFKGETLTITEQELSLLYLKTSKEEHADRHLPHISPEDLRSYLLQQGLILRDRKTVLKNRFSTMGHIRSPDFKTPQHKTPPREHENYSTKLAQYGDDTLKD